MPTSDERLTDLEVKVTYHEDTIETLNQCVIELRGELEQMRRAFLQLEQQMAQGTPEAGPANDPPPHY
ncbi:MAG: hypothetical protein AUK47_05910 [Deltaproteobacteria bacterium CG2_30_63_29]|nr:MAG: hypothetical protein AUK47_05910 [Deltaproteobacteria bacterium CG2_30_63_29]